MRQTFLFKYIYIQVSKGTMCLYSYHHNGFMATRAQDVQLHIVWKDCFVYRLQVSEVILQIALVRIYDVFA